MTHVAQLLTFLCLRQRQIMQDLLNEAENYFTAILTGSAISVIWAVLKADPRISEGTYGQGHIYRCPRGHLYIIGECGQANEASRCPECNCPIGGTMHGLAQGNMASNDIAIEIQRRHTSSA